MSPSDRRCAQRPDQGRSGPLAVPSFPFVSRLFSSFLGRSASDPHQMQAPRPRSCARQARSMQNRLGDMHHNQSAVHLLQPSNLFESCSDQIARGRVSHETSCHPSPQKQIGTPAQMREPTRTPLLYSRPVTRSPRKTPEGAKREEGGENAVIFLWGSRATGAPLSS